MEYSAQVKEIFETLKKKYYIVILTTLIAVSISILFSFYILKPVYQSNTTLIVSKGDINIEDTISSEELDVTERLAFTYGKIIKSRTVLNKVINTLNLKYSYDMLYKNVKVESIEGTQLINITVEDSNPGRARNIADTISVIFKDEAVRLTNANKIEVVDAAILNEEPIGPNKVLNILIATILGIIMGVIISLLSEFFNTKLKTQQEVQRYLDIPVLGIIPKDNILK